MKENKSIALKGNGGITLIALVITIIVLIILAGISIAMISGQDGIISKAGAGAAANQLGAAKDKCALLATEAVHDTYQNVYVENGAAATTINAKIDTQIRKSVLSAKSEIETILGNTKDGLVVNNAAGTAITSAASDTEAVGGSIVLKYSDGTTATGTISNGVISWE